MVTREAETTQDGAGRTRRVGRLAARIAESRHLRALSRDPDLNAVMIAKAERATVVGLYGFLAVGLAYTTPATQQFLAAGSGPGDPRWWGAWCAEPFLAGLLLVLLHFETTVLSYGLEPGSVWLSRLKVVLLSATLFMNVVPQLAPLVGPGEFNLASTVLHLVVPVAVYGVAEVLPVVRARMREAIGLAYAAADDHASESTPPAPALASGATSGDRYELPAQPPEAPATNAPPAPAASAPAPGSNVAVSVADRPGLSVRLPRPLLDQLHTVGHQARAQGRPVTAQDVRGVISLPAQQADTVLAELNTAYAPE